MNALLLLIVTIYQHINGYARRLLPRGQRGRRDPGPSVGVDDRESGYPAIFDQVRVISVAATVMMMTSSHV